jgi:nucleoside-diphosphate-sugar epimerase
MRVALTGADGFTGTYLRAELVQRGIECVLLRADLTDPAAVEAEIEREPFDRLIHLAAEAFAASGEWRRFYEVNHVGTLTLLDALARRRPGVRCVLASSAQVYGPGAAGCVGEDHPTRANSHYPLSKLAMETCASAYSDRLGIIITRPFNYTGVGQETRYVIPKIVDHFRRKAPMIELGDIDVRRDFGDVRSVAEAYAGILLAANPPPILNISTGCAHSIHEIVDLAAQISGHRLAVEVNPLFVRPDDVRVLAGDHALLSRTLPDWRPRQISSTLEWMLSSPGAEQSATTR